MNVAYVPTWPCSSVYYFCFCCAMGERSGQAYWIELTKSRNRVGLVDKVLADWSIRLLGALGRHNQCEPSTCRVWHDPKVFWFNWRYRKLSMSCVWRGYFSFLFFLVFAFGFFSSLLIRNTFLGSIIQVLICCFCRVWVPPWKFRGRSAAKGIGMMIIVTFCIGCVRMIECFFDLFFPFASFVLTIWRFNEERKKKLFDFEITKYVSFFWVYFVSECESE